MQLDILFLDVDGVLNPIQTQHPHVFAPECVTQLKRLFAACPQLRVVFSTSWRRGTPFFVLGWLWRQHQLPLQIVIGRTSDIAPDQRGEEVSKWLAESGQRFPGCKVRRFAALDDEPEPLLKQLPSKTVFVCDSEEGLTDEIANRLIRHFSA